MLLMLSGKFRGILGCILITGGGVFAQAPTAGSISGTVVTLADNSPIRRAVVTLATVEAQPQDAVAWTDAAGRFSFSYLPAGRYQLRATKNGFQPAAFGSERMSQPAGIITLAAGENRADIRLPMPALAAISGVIFDDNGDPLPFAQVQILRLNFQRHKRSFAQVDGAATDASGRYRVANMMPGKYAVMAESYRPTIKAQSEVNAGQPLEQHVFSLQYYPGTANGDSATLVNVESGKQTEQISFRLTSALPTAVIQGAVTLPAAVIPAGGVQITAVGKDPAFRGRMNTQANPPDFNFAMPGLRPDRYVVIARASFEGKTYRATQEVDLRGQPPPAITLTLEPGVAISGRVTMEGPDAAKHAVTTVTLSPGDAPTQMEGPPLRATVNKDGTFLIPNVVAGVWDINASPVPPGGYLKSMRLGTQDVLTEEMVITAKSAGPLNIVVSTQGAALEGNVTNGKDEAPRAVVLLAPDGKFRDVISFYQFATADEKGHYTLKGVTPGKYRLYTMADVDNKYVQDVETNLKPLERFGVAIELKEGQQAKQNLTFVVGDAGRSQ